MSVVKTGFQLILPSILYLCFICDASETDNSSYTNVISHIKDLLASDENVIKLSNVISNISKNGGQEIYNLGLSNKDKDLNITQLLKKYGYPVEVHNVTTSDGYVLIMHRIPGNGSAVFLMHGFISSSDDWVTAGPDSALPYLLASEGYDVWMGNARGNKHSRQHVSLTTADTDFWDFSWDEIGRYDLPAMIDYVLNVTSQPHLKYVGHSQGTTTFFVMCSERPEYNAKISLMVSLSTVAWMSHLESPARLIAPFYSVIHAALSAIGVYEINSETPLITTVTRGICGNTVLADLICSNLMYLFGGFNYPQLNLTNAPVIFGHYPGGSSIKQLIHFGQEIISGKFRRYDYGSLKNLAKYGSLDPPDYSVQNITAPMAIFYSPAMDWFSNFKDVQIFLDKSVSVVELYKVPIDVFSHSDFQWAKDVKKLVYSRILELLPMENLKITLFNNDN